MQEIEMLVTYLNYFRYGQLGTIIITFITYKTGPGVFTLNPKPTFATVIET